ncbi:defensin-2-like [Calliopsis andreniformis]|uniref:defensin-2-like n=1 Tax=Calliopsis andreniformis TaxID=337506 RepID=UPI003FCDEF80
MKLLAVLCIFALIVYTSALSAPHAVYDGPVYEMKRIDDGVAVKRMAEPDELDVVDDTDLSRPRRVTCDLLSFASKWLSVNHSACAFRCLTQRRRGGRCQNGVCVCR